MVTSIIPLSQCFYVLFHFTICHKKINQKSSKKVLTKVVEFDIIAKLYERDGNEKGNLEKSLKKLKKGVDKIKELMYNNSCTTAGTPK